MALFLLWSTLSVSCSQGFNLGWLPTETPAIIYVSPEAEPIISKTPQPSAPALATPDTSNPVIQSSGQTYYVSGGGSDGNAGTLEQPWQTLQYAVNQLQPGDTLRIRGGTYQENFRMANSGTATAPILISNYAGEEVIIDGMGNTLPQHDSGTPLVSIVGDWVTLQNITVQYSGELGVYAGGVHVTLENLYVHHSWNSGVVLSGDYDLIQNSRIWYNSMMNEYHQSPDNWAGGVSCARYPDYCTIRNTTSWENWGEGIATFEALHTTIEGNFSYDNQQNFYISDTKYTLMQGNFSYCSTGNFIDSYETQNGILVGDEKGVPIPLGEDNERFSSSDNTFINNIVVGCNHNLAVGTDQSTNNLYAFNTFVNSSGTTNEEYNVIFYRGTASNARFINNVIVQQDQRQIAIASGGGVVFSHNLWSSRPPANVSGEGDIIGDPLLQMEGLPYLPDWVMLTASSPARNAALPLSEVTVDFWGHPRDGQPDLGAVEFVSP